MPANDASNQRKIERELLAVGAKHTRTFNKPLRGGVPRQTDLVPYPSAPLPMRADSR